MKPTRSMVLSMRLPIESGKPSFDTFRHGKSCQVGRMDGGAARVLRADMISWATTLDAASSQPNELWFSPNASPNGFNNGH